MSPDGFLHLCLGLVAGLRFGGGGREAAMVERGGEEEAEMEEVAEAGVE